MKKWFNNLKIRSKLLFGFGIVIMLAVISTMYSFSTIGSVDTKYTNLIEAPLESRRAVLAVGRAFSRIRHRVTATALIAGNKEYIEANFQDIAKFTDEIVAELKNYKNAVEANDEYTDAEKKERFDWADDITSKVVNDYVVDAQKVKQAALNNDIDEIRRNVAEMGQIPDYINQKIDERIEALNTYTIEKTSKTTKTSKMAMIIVQIVGGILIVISILIAFSMANALTKPLIEIVKKAKQLAEGNLNIAFRTNAKDEIGVLSNSIGDVSDVFKTFTSKIDSLYKAFECGEIDSRINIDDFNGEYKDVAKDINIMVGSIVDDTLYLTECLNSIGNGNFDFPVKQFPGKKAIATNSIQNLQTNLKSVKDDLNYLINAAIQGELEATVDANKYNNNWQQLVKGLNELLCSVSEPISDANEILEKLSKGNFNISIDKKYHGNFQKMAKSLSTMILSTGSYIDEISKSLTEISKGNLCIQINREYVGQFSQIKTSINTITTTLNKIITEINISAQNVLLGAKQISSSAMDLADGASSQAGSIQELTSSAITIDEQIKTNAENSQVANELSEKSILNAQKGNREMQNMLVSMDGIKEASSNISKIIKVIDDIAFQTNLLALNAAVEAARAGQHGKGFAVVAEEVRNLAGRSQQAAQETTVLIEDSILKVNNGTQIAKTTASALDTIVNDANSISSIINNIYKSSKEQSEAISQISVGLNQISQVVQSNSSTSEESAAAAEELTSQSEALSKMISYFTI